MTATVSYNFFTWNGTATSGATKQVVAESAARQTFYFRNLSTVKMVLNFGAAATSSSVLSVQPGEAIQLTKNIDPYDLCQAINVFCANADNYEAASKE